MSTPKPPNNPSGDGAPVVINGGIGGVSITGGAGGPNGDGGAVHITAGSGGNANAPAPDKASLLKIAPGAKITNSTISGNTIVGDANLIDNQGSIENSNIERNLLTIPPDDPWYKKPVGIIGIGLFVTIIAALFLARLNQWF